METRVLTRLFAVVLVLSFCGVLAAEPVRVIYVDDDAKGVNDGSSWQNAYPRLQDALARAKTLAKPVEIRVAQGVYKPDQGAGITPGNKKVSFQLLNGVTLKGGYAGIGAPDPNACDIDRFETVLSGDLRDNDASSPSTVEDNGCRVVLANLTDTSAVMDGFTIIGEGSFKNLCANEYGNQGGVVIDAGEPWLNHCRFMAQLMIHNGGAPTVVGCEFQAGQVFSIGSNPVLINCIFNKGDMVSREGNPSLTDCIFESGTLTSSRGDPVTLTGCVFRNTESLAMEIYDSHLVLTDCLFERNQQVPWVLSTIKARGCYLTLSGCRFVKNGGVCIETWYTDTNLTRCSFIANTDRNRYAGAISSAEGSLVLRDCEFIGNSGYGCPGAIQIREAYELRAAGCLFAGNADSRGLGAAAIYAQTVLLLLSNCTFVGNRGSIATMEYSPVSATARAELAHCIVRDGPSLFKQDPLDPPRINITYSNIQGGHPGKSNIDVDPCFVDPGFWADPDDATVELGPDNPKAVWVDGDYHLKSRAGHWDRESRTWVRDEVTSPCIDAGDPNAPLGLEPFPNGAIVNLGAYGGTAEASKSYFGGPVCETQIAGDINGDCKVDQTDMDILLAHWLMEEIERGNTPPTVTITHPADGEVCKYPPLIPICADAADVDGSVVQVRFRMRGDDYGLSLINTDIRPADGWCYDWSWWPTTNIPLDGTYEIWAEAMDDDGAITISRKVKVTLRAAD